MLPTVLPRLPCSQQCSRAYLALALEDVVVAYLEGLDVAAHLKHIVIPDMQRLTVLLLTAHKVRLHLEMGERFIR